ncbi:MAG: hypothetical protein C4560_03105 [Nitrospiraceae bacterium]|nr:MAG: hypothetical protein C4560_03105 [Nitrospiraceae bacterium]
MTNKRLFKKDWIIAFGILTVCVLCSVFLVLPVLAADVPQKSIYHPNQPPYFRWTLATAQAVTGDSDTATGVDYCEGAKTLTITTAGASVNLTVTPKEGAAAKAIKTYTFTTADTKIISITHSLSTWKATSAITAGTVSITLECAGRR